MDAFIKIVVEGGVAIWSIMALGFFGAVIVIERIKVLYFSYSLNSSDFTNKVNALIKSDKLEEAVSYSAAHEKSLLGYVAKSILVRADRDDDAIQQALDISLSETIPKVARRMGYLSMVSNVATLIGLLGTIQGLIMSFEAVSFADPSQKQTLLAQGISTSMNTTAFGLCVAIPIMICYAFLHSKQSQLLEELTENSAKIIDTLSARNYQGFDSKAIYTSSNTGLGSDAKTPSTPPSNKAS